MPLDVLEELATSSREAEDVSTSVLYRLPPELLVRILYEVQSWYIMTYNDHDQWLNALLLCRRTWLVALNSPELWSRIAFGSRGKWKKHRHWRRLCIERSQERPLDVSIYLDPHYLPDSACAEILQLAPRMNRCELIISSSFNVPGYASPAHTHLHDTLLSRSWPSLRVFDIIAGRRIDVTSELLHGQSDSLTRLSVTSGPVRLMAAPIFSRLQHLKLERLIIDSDGAPQQLREFLSHLSALASLNLDFDNPSSSKDMLTPHTIEGMALQTPIQLPHLRYVHLSGLPRPCQLVLSMISETYKELVIEIEAGRIASELFSVAGNDALVSRAMIYATYGSSNAVTERELVYRLCDLTHDIGIDMSILSALKDRSLSTETRRLHYSLLDDPDTEAKIIQQFAQSATTIIIQRGRNYFDVFPIIASLQGPLKVLAFVDWVSVWAVDEEKTRAVGDTLKAMKQNGRPLEIIQLDCLISSHGIERVWLRDGLVFSIKYTDGDLRESEHVLESGVQQS